MKKQNQKTYIFSDIDGIIWPEVPVLFEIAKFKYPYKKHFLKTRNLKTFTIKAEFNNPPLLNANETKEIFSVYRKLSIFKYKLNNLTNVIKSNFNYNIKIDFSKYIKNINTLNRLSRQKDTELVFFSTRSNYETKKVRQDTTKFLRSYNLPGKIYFTHKNSKSSRMYSYVKSHFGDDIKNIYIVLIEDNILEICDIIYKLRTIDIQLDKIILIDFPWNRFKDRKEELLKNIDFITNKKNSDNQLDQIYTLFNKEKLIRVTSLKTSHI